MKTNRRNFITTIGAGAAGITLGYSKLPVSDVVSDDRIEKDDDQLLFIGDNHVDRLRSNF